MWKNIKCGLRKISWFQRQNLRDQSYKNAKVINADNQNSGSLPKLFQRESKFIRDYWCDTLSKTICESIYELKTKGLISQAEKISSQYNMESLQE